MASLAIVLLGATSLGRMPIDLFPNINYPSICRSAPSTRAPASRTSSEPSPTPSRRRSPPSRTCATSSRARARASPWSSVQFAWGADLDAGLTEVVQRIQADHELAARSAIQQPFILKFDLSNIPVCLVTRVGRRARREAALRPRLQHHRAPDRAARRRRLRQRGRRQDPPDHRQPRTATSCSPRASPSPRWREAVNDANFLLPSGDVKLGTLRLQRLHQQPVLGGRAHGGHRGPPYGHGTPIRVRDVGRVEDSAETQQSVVRVNGERARVPPREQAAGRQHRRQSWTRSRRTLPKLLGLPPGVSVSMSLRPVHVHPAIDPEPLARGGHRLHRWPSSSSCSSCARSSRPSSSASRSRCRSCLTLVAMYFLGQTLNIFTLGGLALAVGRLVDDSIVELENINRHLAMPGNAAAHGGARRRPRSGHAHLRLHHHHHRGLPAHGLPRGPGAAPLHPADASPSPARSSRSFLVSRTVTPLLCLPLARSRAALTGGASRKRPYSRVLAWSRTRPRSGWTRPYQRALSWALGHRKTADRRAFSWPRLGAGRPSLIGTEFFPALRREPVHHPHARPGRHRGSEETERMRRRRWKTIIRQTLKPERVHRRSSPPSGVPDGRSGLFSTNTGPHSAQLAGLPERPGQSGRAATATSSRRSGPSSAASSPAAPIPCSSGGIVSRILQLRRRRRPSRWSSSGYDLKDAQTVSRGRSRGRSRRRRASPIAFVSREENYPQYDIVVDREKAATAGCPSATSPRPRSSR